MSNSNLDVTPPEHGQSINERYPLTRISSDSRFLDTDWLREGWSDRYVTVKRVVDVILGMLFLVLFVVTLPLIAIAIKIDSRGPILYMQERVGKNGKSFNVIKYRSMSQDAERDGARFATRNDVRITRVGSVLRTTRLDELPQAINVLRGEMTVVGPRPERPHVIDMMSAIEPAFRMRTVVLPGLTGHAQVKAHYAANNEQLLTKLEYDLYYIRNASPMMDLRIMFQTVKVIFRRQGT